MLPTSMPLLNDKKFLTDREDFMGRSWAKADIEKGQPEAMAHMRRAFDLLETLLQDGRQWVAGTDDVSLADIQGLCAAIFSLDVISTNLRQGSGHLTGFFH